MEIQKFKNFDINIINENFYIPNVKIDSFLGNVETASNKHVLAIEAKYKTFKQYINIDDKKKHIFKVNDVTGDLLNNNRVIMYLHCFHSYEIDKIRDNIISYCVSTFYSELPQQITIFGAVITPAILIDKDSLKKIFASKITKEATVKIISVMTGYAYDGVQDEFYMWRKGE